MRQYDEDLLREYGLVACFWLLAFGCLLRDRESIISEESMQTQHALHRKNSLFGEGNLTRKTDDGFQSH
jgi:hypothetical protein